MKRTTTADHIERRTAESEALFLSIGEGAIVTDEQGRISRINQVALDILGFKKEDLLGAWYPTVIIAEDEDGRVLPNIERPITAAFLNKKAISTRVYYRRKDSSRVIVHLTVSPVMLEGKPIGAIEVFHDITSEVELEKAKDEFISLASHQLRTPASAVKQYAGLLLEGYVGDLTSQQFGMVKTMYESNERQIKIVNDLLKVAQVDAGKVTLHRRKVNIIDLVEDIIHEQSLKLKAKQQKVHLLADTGTSEVSIDPERMRMVIENIIDNASKYTIAGKTIDVSVAIDDGQLHLTVRDEGVGIAKQDIDLMFQKFSRIPNALSDTVGGTGLGLYWAKKIIDLHGGTIEVQSRLRKGTAVTLSMPIDEPEPGSHL